MTQHSGSDNFRHRDACARADLRAEQETHARQDYVLHLIEQWPAIDWAVADASLPPGTHEVWVLTDPSYADRFRRAAVAGVAHLRATWPTASVTAMACWGVAARNGFAHDPKAMFDHPLLVEEARAVAFELRALEGAES